jgi:16S rRNA (cytosine967-C5)-methyltransferase
MLVAHLLDANPGEKILDACAAPGGKTTHLAALLENSGEIVALDKYPQRVELIRQGMARLGCEGITTRVCDLRQPDEALGAESFARVLLDAPCSGLGVLRRNPEARWQKSGATIRELAGLQTELLARVAPLVKPGGVLLYSVCTFTRAETDDVVDAFLEKHKDFSLESLQQHVPQEWQELLDERGCLRTYPHRHDGMDAFFAARLHRKDGES